MFGDFVKVSSDGGLIKSRRRSGRLLAAAAGAWLTQSRCEARSSLAVFAL